MFEAFITSTILLGILTLLLLYSNVVLIVYHAPTWRRPLDLAFIHAPVRLFLILPLSLLFPYSLLYVFALFILNESLTTMFQRRSWPCLGPRTPRSNGQESVGGICIYPRHQYHRPPHNRLTLRLGVVSWCNLGMCIYLVEETRTSAHIRSSPLLVSPSHSHLETWLIDYRSLVHCIAPNHTCCDGSCKELRKQEAGGSYSSSPR